MKARRNWRWLVLAVSVLAFAGLSPFLSAASGAGASSLVQAGPVAPSAVLTSGPARIVTATREVQVPARPAGVQINRPSIPMAQYRAMKAASARSGAAKPSLPGAPASSNQIIGQAALTSQGGSGGSWAPPDINGSVGRNAPFSNQIAEIVNSKLSVWTKSPNAPALVQELGLNAKFGYSAASLFDPRIEYDARWNRWVAVADAFQETNGSQHFIMAISSTSDASGGWIVYNFVLPIGAGGFVDYPQLSLTQDAIVMTYSDFATAGQTCLTFSVAKAIAYNAQGFSTPVFALSNNCTVTPPNVIDQNPRAHELLWIPGAGAWNVEFRNPQTGFYSAISAINAVPNLGTAPPPNAQQPAAPACTAPSCDIDALDGRFANDPTQYGDSLWAFNTTGFGIYPIPSWFEYDTEGAGANTAKQSNYIYVSGSSFDWNASIAAQTDGRAYLQWTYTDPTAGVYPSMAFTGRLSGDAVNTVNVPTVVFNSAFKMMGNYDGNFGAQRWGDTSSIRFDPTNPDRAYGFNETVPNSGFWGTRQEVVRVNP